MRNELQIIDERELLGKEFKMYGDFENPLLKYESDETLRGICNGNKSLKRQCASKIYNLYDKHFHINYNKYHKTYTENVINTFVQFLSLWVLCIFNYFIEYIFETDECYDYKQFDQKRFGYLIKQIINHVKLLHTIFYCSQTIHFCFSFDFQRF